MKMATSTADKDQNTGVIPGEWHVRYIYSVGKVAGKYFDGLKARKILATRCNKSGLTYLPRAPIASARSRNATNGSRRARKA
jgi:uncharacterized OB-fold protein